MRPASDPPISVMARRMNACWLQFIRDSTSGETALWACAVAGRTMTAAAMGIRKKAAATWLRRCDFI